MTALAEQDSLAEHDVRHQDMLQLATLKILGALCKRLFNEEPLCCIELNDGSSGHILVDDMGVTWVAEGEGCGKCPTHSREDYYESEVFRQRQKWAKQAQESRAHARAEADQQVWTQMRSLLEDVVQKAIGHTPEHPKQSAGEPHTFQPGDDVVRRRDGRRMKVLNVVASSPMIVFCEWFTAEGESQTWWFNSDEIQPAEKTPAPNMSTICTDNRWREALACFPRLQGDTLDALLPEGSPEEIAREMATRHMSEINLAGFEKRHAGEEKTKALDERDRRWLGALRERFPDFAVTACAEPINAVNCLKLPEAPAEASASDQNWREAIGRKMPSHLTPDFPALRASGSPEEIVSAIMRRMEELAVDCGKSKYEWLQAIKHFFPNFQSAESPVHAIAWMLYGASAATPFKIGDKIRPKSDWPPVMTVLDVGLSGKYVIYEYNGHACMLPPHLGVGVADEFRLCTAEEIAAEKERVAAVLKACSKKA